MVTEFSDIVTLNNAYQAMLASMAEYNNTNDEILSEMLLNLMCEYKSNLKLLEQRRLFEHFLFVQNKKMEDKQELITLKLHLRKMKFLLKQTKRANRLLFSEFKQENTVNVVAERLKPKEAETTAVEPVSNNTR